MIRLNAQQLRTSPPDPDIKNNLEKNDIYIVVDNVLDTYNVGAIFRLADAVAARKIILCGETLTPPNTRIKKASINTWEWVEWEYSKSAIDAIRSFKAQDPKLKVFTVEQDEKAVPFYSQKYEMPLALVVGNETYGVSKEVREAADRIVELPMWGINKSLNVMVSLGIALYEVIRQCKA